MDLALRDNDPVTGYSEHPRCEGCPISGSTPVISLEGNLQGLLPLESETWALVVMEGSVSSCLMAWQGAMEV